MIDSPRSEGATVLSATLPSAAKVSPVQASSIAWLSVALWNFGDIARMPVRPNGLAVRVAHHAVDLGHVLAVLLATAAVVALWTRYGPRRRIWSEIFVAVVVGALGPVVLSGDLEGALDRLFPNRQSAWLLIAVCVGISQAATACFIAGRLCARPRLRWLSVALGLSLIVANDFVLENGYPGTHVLMSSSGAILVAASLTGARWGRFGELVRRLGSARLLTASLLWVPAAALATVSVIKAPPNSVQVELLERDTPLLFPWLRTVYATARAQRVSIPRELRHWFESRAERPDIPPAVERFLPDAPIVVMITIDALRNDVLHSRHRQSAPNLHEMRRNSVYFSQARSSASDTRYSMATLFTGVHFSMLSWTTKKDRRLTLENDERPRLPELLQAAGVQTVSVRTVTMLHPRNGIVRGFDEEFRREEATSNQSTRSDQVADQIIDRLRRQGPEPLFLYTHLMDPHAPYETYGKPVASRFEAYLIEVSVADANIGRIRRAISESGLKARTALIIGSDHGEGFGEHRLYTHAKPFYDVMVRVPLMIELPGVAPRTVDDFVALMDLAPTVLDFFRVPTPGPWMSESLTPFLAGRRGDPTRMVLMEKPTHKAMLFSDGLKVMKRRGVYELYDVRRDPDENHNLWEELGDEGPRRLGLLDAYVRAHARRRGGDSDGDD
jgi:arylsulfatase A-like enzyme